MNKLIRKKSLKQKITQNSLNLKKKAKLKKYIINQINI